MRRLVPGFVFFAALTLLPGAAQAQSATGPAQIAADPAQPTAATEKAAPETSTGPSQPSRPFEGLFTGAVRDLTRLARKQPLIILGAGAQAAILSVAADRSIRRHVPAAEGVDDAMDAGSVLGNGMTQGGAALGVYVVGRLLDKPAMTNVGGDLIEAQLVSGALTQTLKLSVARARPRGTSHKSFPSGHTSATFATAAVLQERFGWRVGIPVYAAAAYVGLSRVSEDEHYFSDVVFGAAVGIASARAVAIGRHARVQVAPYVARGGGAITFIVLPSTH